MNRTITIIFVCAATLYFIISFVFALNGYPGFRQDAVCFLPTSYFISHQHQLINPLYDAGIDPIKHRFLFYPPLFPYTISVISSMIPFFYNKIQITLMLIDFFSITIIMVSVYIYIKKNHVRPSYLLYIFLLFWCFALFSFSGISEGRPETLSTFFIACFLLNNVSYPKSFSNLINGLLIGLNSINSSVSTFYLIIITIGLLFYFDNFKIKPIVQTAIGCILVLVCFVYFYPYHIIELIQAMSKHSHNSIFNRVSLDRIGYFKGIYILSIFRPFTAFTFSISIIYTFYALIKQKKTSTIVLFVILVVVSFYFSFKVIENAYNMFVLSPLFLFIIIVFFVDIYNKKILINYSNLFTIALIFLLFVNTLGFIRTTLVYFCTQDKKVSFEHFREDFKTLSKRIKKNRKIYVTFSLWPYCLDGYKQIARSSSDTSIQFMMIQQSNSGNMQPSTIDGYSLIKNEFISDHPKLGKIQISNTYPWYQTAIYERK